MQLTQRGHKGMHTTGLILQRAIKRMAARRHGTAILVVAALIVGTAAITSVPTHASAASQPIFTVMNTSETLPDGVWFRYAPHTADTTRTTGLGVYKNERVQLKCYAWGDAVGPYSDRLWYWVLNVTRPTNNGVPNQGYLNAHYINDGKLANQVDAGVALCGPTPTPTTQPKPTAPPAPTPQPTPPPTSTPVAGYYSPFNIGARGDDGKVEDLRDQNGVHTSGVDAWYACSAASDKPYFALDRQLKHGQFYNRVGGWSLGRLGPAYLIQGMQKHDRNQLRQLNYIILIDPGNKSDLSPCDVRNGSGRLYAAWLKYNSNARLVILSGTRTQQNSSQGIQEVYFNAIRNQARGTNIRSRVVVCNYNAGHYDMYDAGQYWIKHVVSANSCPTLNYKGTYWHPTATWHP